MGRKLTVPQAHKVFFQELVSEWTIYKAIREKSLPCCRVGRRILLDEDSLAAWWRAQEEASVAVEPEAFGKIRRLK